MSTPSGSLSIRQSEELAASEAQKDLSDGDRHRLTVCGSEADNLNVVGRNSAPKNFLR